MVGNTPAILPEPGRYRSLGPFIFTPHTQRPDKPG